MIVLVMMIGCQKNNIVEQVDDQNEIIADNSDNSSDSSDPNGIQTEAVDEKKFDILEQMEPAQSDEGTDKQIRTYGNISKYTADGQYKVYIDDITKNFVIKDLTNGTEEQFEIPDQYFNNLKDELNSGLYWELIGNGIGLYYTLEKGYYNGFVYFSFKDHGLFEISMPIKGFVSFRDGKAFVERAISYRFNSESLRFEVYYERPEYEYHSSIVYQGNFYYDDDEVVLFNADQSMLDNTLFKPYSELPEVYYNDHKVGISSTVQTAVDEYVKIDENSFVGIVKNNEFEPIIEIPVRRFDGDEHGIIYTGYEEDGYAYYVDLLTKQQYELPVDTVVNDVAMIGDKVYILINGKDILCFDRNELIDGTISSIKNEINLTRIEGYTGDAQFNIDDNGEYIIAYVDNNGYYAEKPFKTYVLNQNLELIYDLNGMYLLSTDSNVFFSAYPYCVRCDLKLGSQQVIEDGLVTHLIGGFDNKIVFNDAYEGPGTTWSVDEDVTPIDYSFGDEAYTIMVRPFHQLNFILFDHLKNTINYIYNSSRYEYIIKDDGIYFNTDEGDYILPFLDGGKTVVIKGSGI